jgi:hypothetical protein
LSVKTINKFTSICLKMIVMFTFDCVELGADVVNLK